MRLYIAGASAERGLICSWMAVARRDGIEITHDWVAQMAAVGVSDPEVVWADRRKYTTFMIDAIVNEHFWLLVPKSLVTHTIGAWVELGVALLAAKKTYVSGDLDRCLFIAGAGASNCFRNHEDAYARILNDSKAAS